MEGGREGVRNEGKEREEKRERGTEGGRQEWKEGGREGVREREGGTEGGMKEWREVVKEGVRERERKRGREGGGEMDRWKKGEWREGRENASEDWKKVTV